MTARFLLIPETVASSKLQHYLRTHRRRLGFSQKELAYLLAEAQPGGLSRYENLSREPNLRTAIAFEVIFRVSLREIFAGMYEDVEQQTLDRVRRLSERLHTSDVPAKRHEARRAQVEAALLTLLAHLQSNNEYENR